MTKTTSLRAFFTATATVACVLLLGCPAPGAQTTVNVFRRAGIQFGGDAAWSAQDGTTILDNGRILERTITLPELGPFSRVTTNLRVIAADDPWDRAASIYVSTTAGDIELHKFITSFGGTTTHHQDITNLIPILRNGPLKIRAFVDTWVQQARTIDFTLTVTDETPDRAPTWGRTLFNDQGWRAGSESSVKRSISVPTPRGLGKVVLSYLPSGHASDGSGGDEFVQRTHHVFVDGVEVWQGIPWRTDGRDFRSVNPTSGRWGDTWSSDLDRSGWIPGDDVDPILIDVSQYMTGGARHLVEFQIDGIRPQDASGYGYWRASSYLTGYEATGGAADFDYDGDVDGSDLLTWQRGYGLTGQVNNGAGDADSSGAVDGLDLAAWQAGFGANSSASALTAVPEASTGALAAIACAAALWRRRRR